MVRTLTISMLSLALAGTLGAGAFAADATSHDQSWVFSQLDTNHDGTISLDEVKAVAANRFAVLDTDREGTLDASELSGVADESAIKSADPDHDGTLDKAEYMDMIVASFKAADTDHDGTLSQSELATAAGQRLSAELAL